MKEHGPWKILASHPQYKDPWIEVRRDDCLRPDGTPGTHCVVHLKPGISVLPLDGDGCVYLTDEFHYGIGRHSLEVVSGGIEPGEDALQTAQRELEEELGIRAARWTPLAAVDPFTTIVVSPTALFFARELQFVRPSPEATEQIGCVKTTLAEAVQWVMQGKITHAPSCVLILKAHLTLGAGQ